MKITTDSSAIVKLLKKKERASAAELGTNKEIMEALTEHGVVVMDGYVKTGKRGRPPVAYKLSNELPETLPDVTPKPKRAPRNGEGLSQEMLDSIISEVLTKHYAGKRCQCLKVGMTPTELRALNSGCTDFEGGHGRWVCEALDAVRRRMAGAR